MKAQVAIVAAAKGRVCITSSCTEKQKLLSQVGKEDTWVLVLPTFWLRYLNRTSSNTHFLTRDWKTDELIALQVKKLSSLGLELDYLEGELVYCLNIGTSDYSQVSICNPFSLCLGINLMQSDSLNPKSLSSPLFQSLIHKIHGADCVLTTIGKSPINLPVAMPMEWLNWWHLFEHALCGWWNATIVHTLCTSGVKGGFSRFIGGG